MGETITVKVPNTHTKLEAKNRIVEGFDKVTDQLGGKASVSHEWNGDTLAFTAGAMGQKVDGTLTVMEEHVVINVNLPWLLAKLAGPISQKLEKDTQLLLE